jgi:hypothetical protein
MPDDNEKKALADIEQYGCHILYVFGEGDLPPFAYSIGIQKKTDAPELVVVGLKQPISHFIVNEYNRRVIAGERFPDGTTVDGFLEGFPCLMRAVDRRHYREYFGWSRWLYDGDGFEVLQMIYPSTDGIWPWDSNASEYFKKRQTLLTLAPH